MQIKRFIITIILGTVLQIITGVAHADTVGFSGYVPQKSGDSLKTIDKPGTLVSFSDEVALTIPLGFGADGELRIFNDHGEVGRGLRLLSLATDSGVNTRVAVVGLNSSLRQTFLLCDGESCVRYKVMRP